MPSPAHAQPPEDQQNDTPTYNPSPIRDLNLQEPDTDKPQSPKYPIPEPPDLQIPQTIKAPDQSELDPPLHCQSKENPHSLKTLTLETSGLQKPHTVEVPDRLEAEALALEGAEVHDSETITVADHSEADPSEDFQAQPESEPEPEGMLLSPSQMVDPEPSDNRLGPVSAPRRGGHKRKKPVPVMKRKAMEKKIEIISQTFRPVCFVPAKSLDFSKHEELLKRFGLWDFVHLELDREIRAELLIQLVVNFNQGNRSSSVNDMRIGLGRAALARALKLPVKKDKASAAAAGEGDMEVLSGESLLVIEDILSNWVLLHDDTWMMPDEVMASARSIKEGHPEKVDWAGLMWFMVEKELSQGVQLEKCYYASHLQCLIKSQKMSLFIEEPQGLAYSLEQCNASVDVAIKDEENDMLQDSCKPEFDLEEGEEEEECGDGKLENDMKGGVEAGDGGNLEDYMKEEDGEKGEGGAEKMTNLVDFQGHEAVGQNLELTLGQDNAEKEEERPNGIMDFVDAREEEPGHWFLYGKNCENEQYLRRCNFDENKDMDSDLVKKEEEEEVDEDGEEEDEEEEAQDEGFSLMPKNNYLDGFSSGNLISTMDGEHIPFNLSEQLEDHLSEEILASRPDGLAVSTGPSVLSNAGKRVIDHENDISLHSLNGNHKRLKLDGTWENKPLDFDSCMGNVQQFVERAKMLYDEKAHACEEFSLNQQILLNELQQRDAMIEHLHKTKFEEIQKKQVEIYRRERELNIMSNVLAGYRKALKETQRAFAEYRQRCPQLDEPLYRDVPVGKGLVLSTTEIEELQRKQEHEDFLNRLMFEKKIKEFEAAWVEKLEASLNAVNSLDSKVAHCAKALTVIKEVFTKSKVSDLSACAAEE